MSIFALNFKRSEIESFAFISCKNCYAHSSYAEGNNKPHNMSKLSNNHGRGYEYACLYELYNEIGKYRLVRIITNSSLEAAKRAYATLTSAEKKNYRISAKAMIPALFECEPRIIEADSEFLDLYIQQDEEGKKGDVRDIIVARKALRWEIGLSIKHNHFAVKHSRLSPTIDFGDKWFGYACSNSYWDEVKPVFGYLSKQKERGKKFNELPHKETAVYVPILNAFMNELKAQYKKHKDIPRKMVEYLLSKYDFYKIISVNRQNLTEIQAYNTHGTLNKPAGKVRPKIIVPISMLPTRIVNVGFVPGRNNTVELFFDGGWSFTFRIHNAETYATPSLKFDIQLTGVPTSINCLWR